jgi:hypothetical protein
LLRLSAGLPDATECASAASGTDRAIEQPVAAVATAVARRTRCTIIDAEAEAEETPAAPSATTPDVLSAAVAEAIAVADAESVVLVKASAACTVAAAENATARTTVVAVVIGATALRTSPPPAGMVYPVVPVSDGITTVTPFPLHATAPATGAVCAAQVTPSADVSMVVVVPATAMKFPPSNEIVQFVPAGAIEPMLLDVVCSPLGDDATTWPLMETNFPFPYADGGPSAGLNGSFVLYVIAD